MSGSEAQPWGTAEDDMTDGDLGDGLGGRPGAICQAEVSHSLVSGKRSGGARFGPPPSSRKGGERNGADLQSPGNKSLQDTCPQGPRALRDRWQSSTESNPELSNEQLRQRLRETLEEVEILKTELEAAQRQLEGKEEALKILQSMAVLDKATSHTQAVLQKTIEQKKSLEKEINTLQWEIEFDQNRFKSIEESWIQKYDRLHCDNAVLKENLKVKTEEMKVLRSENAALNQRYLEALAMLDLKEQKMVLENMGQDASGFTDVSGLELQLLQKSKEEAYMMADAFRIAFEQQLRRRNDQALRLTRVDKMCRRAADRTEDVLGNPSPRNKKTLGQKLLGLLPSENGSRKAEDQSSPQEVFKMLIDLLNDKEEALAHQRKVSYMLARALEHTERKEKHPREEDFPLQNPWHKVSEPRVSGDSAHASVLSFNPGGCLGSVPLPQRDPNSSRTHKRSRSLPSGIC